MSDRWHHTLKSTFLHGKRNRRLDHLIAVLVRDVCPYFAIRYHRNRLGFEGPTLEMRKHQDIESRGKAIPAASVIIIDEQLVEVQSQTTASVKYQVTISPSTCNCPDFPLIRFCKHIYAAQLKFPQLKWTKTLDNTKSLESTEVQHTDTTPNNSKLRLPTESVPITSSLLKTAAEIARLSSSLSIHSLKPGASQRFDVEKLVTIESLLRDALLDSTLKQPFLPPAERLPPNKKTKTETAEAYGRKVPHEKTKRKSTNTDPYSGGERSGKKAKYDALIAENSQINAASRNVEVQPESRTAALGHQETSPQPSTQAARSKPNSPSPSQQKQSPCVPTPNQTFARPNFTQNSQPHLLPASTMPYYYYPIHYYPHYPVYMPYAMVPQNPNPQPTYAKASSEALLPPSKNT